MIILCLLAQLATLEKGLEAGAKESRPVLLFVHRNDWKGAEAVAKGLKEALGKLADQFVLAHVNVQENEAAIKTYGMTKLDGAVWMLDPKLKATASQQLGRLEKDEQLSPEGIKALAEEALKRFAENEACRGALNAMWAAMKKGDKEALKKSIWPVQLEAAGEAGLDAFAAEGAKAAEKWETLAFVSVSKGAIEKMEKLDETVQGIFKVKFDFVKGDKKNGTSMEVVTTKTGAFVIMEK